MHLVTICCIFILGFCTSTPNGNLTAVGLEPLKILCSGGSLQMVEQAISDHIYNSHLASGRAQVGISFRPFCALYKSNEHKQDIVDLFNTVAGLRSIETLLQRGRPTFVCVRSEADASPYRSTVPNLWDRCQDTLPSTPETILPIAHYETNTLFLCRPFFLLPNDREGADSDECPSVQGNKFTDDEPARAVFANRATYITTFAINAYSHFPNTRRVGSYIDLLNFALGWDANFAVTEAWSYLLFERLTKNMCSDIPDIHQPPWNYPRSLGLNATGNVTSEATNNKIIPQNASQLSSSPGSLMQVMPANLVDTS